jgi:hypothetical protein
LVKRVLTGAVVATMAAVAVPLLTATPASAAGSLQGAATVYNNNGGAPLQSGDSATNWTLRLPSGASCPGDGPNAGYRWQTYMVPSAVDPGTLTFGSAGPTPIATGASFRQPLYDTTNNPVVNQVPAAATTAGGPGPIINIPNVNFTLFTPGQIPGGVYNIGIACTLGGESPSQMSNFWNVQMTVSTATAGTGGPAQITWQNGTLPAAPVITTISNGAPNGPGGTLVVSFTSTPSNPATTGYTVTASNGGTPVSVTGAASPITVSGLTNGTLSNVTMVATNAVGPSATSNSVSGTPMNPQVTSLAAAGSPSTVTLTWGQPSGATPAAPTSYTVSWVPTTGASPQTFACATATCSDTIGSLVPGTAYAFTVTYGAAGTANNATTTGTPISNTVIYQDLTVSRPNGALVLTQVCGKWAAMGADVAQGDYPALAASPATTGAGSAPTTDVVGSTTVGGTTITAATPVFSATQNGNTVRGPSIPAATTFTFVDATHGTLSNPATAAVSNGGFTVSVPDPQYAGYPYPDDPTTGASTATFPTHCGVDMGNAHFVTTGSGAGKWFAATARLNQVTIVNTQDNDNGFTVSMQQGGFTGGAGKSFSGDQLGWTLQAADNAPFTASGSPTYDQVVTAGSAIAPNTVGGAGTSHAVATAASGSSLGIATLDARLKLLIPVFAKNGNYAGQLTINAV